MTAPTASRPAQAGFSRRAFTSLALWMLGFGILVGLAFPFAIIPLGVPAEHTLLFSFFSATMLAGIVVGAVNFLLAHRVVGRRLRVLSRQMQHVADVIQEATYTGDWSGCRSEDCKLPVDSDDAFGEAAAGFNRLLVALAASRAVEEQEAAYTARLARYLDVGELSHMVLDGLIAMTEAEAGALLIAHEGELRVEANERLRAEDIRTELSLSSAWKHDGPWSMTVPDTLLVDSAIVSFRPRTVIVLPLRFSGVPIAMVVLAYAQEPPAEVRRLLGNLADPTSVALNNALAHQRFQQLAALDPLTGAYNRRFGLQRLNEEWSRAIRDGGALAILAFDLDHFKAVNDTYGHLAGDRVLKEVTAAARVLLREGDLLVRTGGEEFMVILPGAGSHDAMRVAERLRRTVADLQVDVGVGRVQITVSVGAVARTESDADTVEALREAADGALYMAKNHGRDRVVLAPRGRRPVTA